MKNRVLIKHPVNWGLDDLTVKNYCLELLEEFGFKENTELSVVFVGREKAKKLNQKYRKKDYIPQVLGFPMDKKKDSDGFRHLGDIVICSAKLKYEAEFQKKNNNEILRDWLKHGLENLMIG